MMKKLLTLFITSFTCLGVHAQNVNRSTPAHRQELASPITSASPVTNPPVAAKSTLFMQRWYNHTALVDQMSGGLMNYSLMPMWHDSTVLQVYPVPGAVTINFSSMAEVFDPIHFTKWSDTLIFSSALMSVSDTDAYNVDSISFSGSLLRGTGNRPPTIVDTFILSIAVNDFPKYITDCTTDTWAGWYISCQPGEDTLKGVTILAADVDSVERTQLASNGAIVWKIPIVDSMRHDSVVVDNFTYEVPGGLPVPAGKGFAVTVTFKSGDTWPLNVDTFTKYHNFSGRTGAIDTSSPMPYYYYQYNDHGMSNLMFSVEPDMYAPSVFIEGWNTMLYKFEFHDISAHIGCNNCLTIAMRNYLSVENVNNNKKISLTAYPVPASDEVNISFSLEENADATVSITNTLGQLIATQGVKAGKNNTVKFSTANMAAGIYFYTVEANGQRTTNRFVVSH